MQNAFEIKNLSREEKLRVMEAIWEDLSKEGEQIESPEWHRQALREAEQGLKSGEEKTTDWPTAKKQLRKRFE